MHLSHERNVSLVALAKTRFIEEHAGRLFCEACGFDFCKKYGERGIDFIEVHHKKFISVRTKNEPTRIEDLVMLCSNCHSILHRYQPWLSMEELEQLISRF
ncbi:MAG: HNH endonuclease [Ruminococcaceae bacterium]|nr:HNH endonuclease [Oscillospiraceae bacterium]